MFQGHEHNDWLITYEPINDGTGDHFVVYTCNVCGFRLAERRTGPMPEA